MLRAFQSTLRFIVIVEWKHRTGETCKSASSCNLVVITRSPKDPWSHGTAPIETGTSKRTFQIIPVSQNKTMTHKYHLTSVWTKVNIRYKAPTIASPTRLIYIAYLAEFHLNIFLPDLILSRTWIVESHFVQWWYISLVFQCHAFSVSYNNYDY